MDIIKLSAMEMKNKLENKELTSREIVEAHFARIDDVEEEINAFISLDKEKALESADKVDEKIKNGEKVGLLAGIPIGIKDNIITYDSNTTCGSKMLENFRAPFEATVIEKIKAEDGIIIGKTNMDEFALGSSTETSFFGKTKNPIDLERVPGGSSGGSTAGVKAEEMALALGSDTGGSIRQPASYCGVVGIKPTYGLISRYGLVSVANSLDQIGVVGRDILDAALMLGVISGHDDKDATSMDIENVDYLENIKADIKGMKIGVPGEFFDIKMDPQVKEEVMKAIEIFKTLGAEVEKISLPHIKHGLEAYYIISTAEISSNLARYDGISYGYRAEEYETLDELYMNTRSEAFGDEVKRRIMAGTYFLSSGHAEEYYKKATEVRTLIRKDFEKAFEDFDIIISPTTTGLPFKLGEKADDPLDMYKSDIFTVSVNLAGNCALSIPCGYVGGLPVGLQIIGDNFKEENILNAGYALEKHLSLGGFNNEL